MTVFKVSFCHAWDRWHDFTFVTCRTKKEAIVKALEEIDVPELMNDKVIITVSVEGTVGKTKKKKSNNR
ncbi:hypothetical protein P7H00_12610 [Enterococcus pseudoavium]|uniref:Uncharacterized protein n=1 Tax=Enterococcus pseudoavium TaxID=44007 RepID=A0AAE4I4E8_9ENTE|nr:hypothetical protein [Enterococcus pseudoavium]MDT2737952.1 hypothetical protein [Enterococcus pseudoavium]